MAKEATLQVRMDAELKEKAEGNSRQSQAETGNLRRIAGGYDLQILRQKGNSAPSAQQSKSQSHCRDDQAISIPRIPQQTNQTLRKEEFCLNQG